MYVGLQQLVDMIDFDITYIQRKEYKTFLNVVFMANGWTRLKPGLCFQCLVVTLQPLS